MIVTYRLQLQPGFGFGEARRARSTHGYDVTDHNRIQVVGYAVLLEFLLRLVPQERVRWLLRPWLWLAPALVLLSVFLLYPPSTPST